MKRPFRRPGHGLEDNINTANTQIVIMFNGLFWLRVGPAADFCEYFHIH